MRYFNKILIMRKVLNLISNVNLYQILEYNMSITILQNIMLSKVTKMSRVVYMGVRFEKKCVLESMA